MAIEQCVACLKEVEFVDGKCPGCGYNEDEYLGDGDDDCDFGREEQQQDDDDDENRNSDGQKKKVPKMAKPQNPLSLDEAKAKKIRAEAAVLSSKERDDEPEKKVDQASMTLMISDPKWISDKDAKGAGRKSGWKNFWARDFDAASQGQPSRGQDAQDAMDSYWQISVQAEAFNVKGGLILVKCADCEGKQQVGTSFNDIFKISGGKGRYIEIEVRHSPSGACASKKARLRSTKGWFSKIDDALEDLFGGES